MLFEGQAGKWPVLATDRDLRARLCRKCIWRNGSSRSL